jgi:hypothetical protein
VAITAFNLSSGPVNSQVEVWRQKEASGGEDGCKIHGINLHNAMPTLGGGYIEKYKKLSCSHLYLAKRLGI